MKGETVAESLFSNNFRRTWSKSIVCEPDKAVIGILAFEVASLMSKVANLWHCLSDGQIARLRKKLGNSLGIKRLVSDDGDYVMDLALAEIIQNFESVARAVARLGKKCMDPVYQHLDHVFDNPIEINLNWCGWEYRLKKMERKVKKMERFVALTAQLYQDLEMLAELERSLRRIQGKVDINQVKLLEFQRKVIWQRHVVKNLREMSPWLRTYDYTVRLLLRSLLTIVRRIKHVCGINRLACAEAKANSENMTFDCLNRSYSISARMYTSVHLSGNSLSGSDSGQLRRSVSNLGLSADKIRTEKHYQAHLHQSKASGLAYIGHFKGCIMGGSESPLPHKGCMMSASQPPFPFRGCMTAASESPAPRSCMQRSNGSLRSTRTFSNDIQKAKDCNILPLSSSNLIRTKSSFSISKRKLLNFPPSTLGATALALRYANIIILIEKLASSPYMISLDGRDDLYNMLSTSLRNSLRGKLKEFPRTLASAVHYDSARAADCHSALARLLEWLAPLAHNTIRWHSERNFEKKCMGPWPNVLLVQTLHFANQVKTEAAIIQLVMGLNYISRFARETDEEDFVQSTGCDDYLLQEDNMVYSL